MIQDPFKSHWFGIAKPGRSEFGQVVFESASLVDGVTNLAERMFHTPFHDGFVIAVGSTEDIVRKRLAKHQRANRSDLSAQLAAKLANLGRDAEASEGKDLPTYNSALGIAIVNEALAKPASESKSETSKDSLTSADIDAILKGIN